MLRTKQFSTFGFIFIAHLSLGMLIYLSWKNEKPIPQNGENKSYFVNFITDFINLKRKRIGYGPLKALNILQKRDNQTIPQFEENTTENDKENEMEQQRKEEELKREEERKRKEEEERIEREKQKEEERKKAEEKERKEAYNNELSKWEKKIKEAEAKYQTINSQEISVVDQYHELNYQVNSITGINNKFNKFNKYRSFYSLPKDPNGMWCAPVANEAYFNILFESQCDVMELFFPSIQNSACTARVISDGHKNVTLKMGTNVHVPFKTSNKEMSLIAYNGNGTHVCIPDFRIIGECS